MNAWLIVPMLVTAAYLIGGIPFGVVVGRMCGVDVRKQGSGNIGATNVGRVLGRKLGGLVFALDVLKGLLPTLAAGTILAGAAAAEHWSDASRYLCWLAVGVASVIGHNYPVYLRFRGGKGVATSLGATLGVYPDLTYPALIALGVWVVVVAISRYVSLGSICAGIALPLSFAGLSAYRGRSVLSEGWPLLLFALLVATMVIVRHRSNVRRLLAGTEPKMGSHAAGPDDPVRPRR